MGNIFKTLGIDDFFRDHVPIVGKTVGDFLAGQGGSNSQQYLGQLGPNQGRISNEDYQHNQNLLDSSNPREIKRTGAFLEGLAPSQAAAHNTFQDATYQANVDREIGGIKAKAEGLGMSPWEITGIGGASPLPSPQSPMSQNNSGYLSTVVPLKVAEMQNKTALAQTKMQTDTTKYVADQQTNKGGLPQQQQAQVAAQTILTSAQATKTAGVDTELTKQQTETGKGQAALAWSQSAAADNQQVLNAITTLTALLPTKTINMGAYSTTEKHGYQALTQMATTLGDSAHLPAAVGDYIRNLPPKQWTALEEDIIKLATTLTQGARGGIKLLDEGGEFLRNIGRLSRW